MRTKFKLGQDASGWVVFRGHWAPKEHGYKWRPESHHPALPEALRFLHDRLVAENYQATGLEDLVLLVEASYDRVAAYARELLADPSAEMEV